MDEYDDYQVEPTESDEIRFRFDDDSIITLSDNYPTIEYPKHRIGRYIADEVAKLMAVRGWTDARTKEYIIKTYGIKPL
jgi:hypothetical protein